MANPDNLQLFDLRTVRRNIARGRTEQEEYKAFLADLPDVSDKIRAPDEGGDDDGYDARGDRRAEPEAGAAPAPEQEDNSIVPPMPENPAPAPPPPDPPVI